MNGLRKLWQLLTDPPKTVFDPERRRQIRFLSALLPMLAALGLMLALERWLMGPAFRPTSIVIVAAIGLLAVAYGIVRRGHDAAGAVLAVAVTTLVGFGAILVNPDDSLAYAYLSVGLIMAALLFSGAGVIGVATITFFGLVLLQPIRGIRPPDGDLAPGLIFMLMLSVLLIVMMRHHRALQRERRAPLQKNEVHQRTSSQMLDAVLNGTPVLVACFDPEFNFLLVNRAYAADEGKEPGFFPGKNHFALYPDAENRAIFRRVVESGEPYRATAKPFKFAGATQRGLTYWDWNLSPIKDPDGRVTSLVLTLMDVTAHIDALVSLQESETRFRATFDQAAVGIAHVSPDGRWLRVNQKLCEITGYSAEELLRRSAQDITHPGDLAREVVLVRQMLADEIKTYSIEKRYLCANREALWVDQTVSLVRNLDGSPMYFVLVSEDISKRKRAEEALIQSEANFRAMTENANIGMMVNHRGRHVFANATLLRMLGYSPDEFRNTGVEELVHPDEYQKVVQRYRERLAGKDVDKMYETVFVARDGRPVPVELTAAVTSWQGEPATIVLLHDISARKLAEEQMRKLSSAVEQTADSVMITDRKGIIEYVNPAFEKTTGYLRDEAVGQTPQLMKSGKQGTGFYQKLWQTILAGEPFSEVFVNRRKDGSLYYDEKTITPIKDAGGFITHFVATGKDVTERVQTQERLQHMAQHDALTELPNRILFLDRLKQALARARWHARLVAVLFVDIDRFKTINDTLGHELGDCLLQALAARFSRSVREGDTVARFGGDEFVILLDDVGSEGDIGQVAQKVMDVLVSPFEVDGHALYITASIGVSLYPNDGEDSGSLLKNADIAMYRAKELGKNNYQFYSADMSARAFERLTLESSLRHALKRGEFRIHYQQQVDAATGAIVGFEALLRWQHPDFGLVMPNDFIPLLEETGLIVQVGEWVLQTACAQLRDWRLAGWRGLRLAVNLSPRQFNAPGLVQAVENALHANGCDPGQLELEITEGVLMQHVARTHDVLDALRALGTRLAIDDFGTGYSSLSYLRRFPIDTLKIDRSFVHDIPGDTDDSAITTAIIALARSLKLETVAEGVENESQRDFLRAHGCRVMQGCLFGRPVPAEELTRLLDAREPPA